ncbi:MAG: histidinol-phosphate transaminase [Candidatus Omnitrophica bacterium]|nr:histidinol-phosphate transaminase [Candidatus Omnitrophota bacterium]
MVLARKHLIKVAPYQAGRPIEEVKRQFALRNVIKLASNENPLGPSPKALVAIKKNLHLINRYPDANGFYLKRKLAQVFNVSLANIVLGNGSDELIDIIVKAFVEKDEGIITSEGTFLEYKIISQVHGRKVTTVPLRNFKYDLEAIKKKINPKTKVVFISNPNNPTGTYVTQYEIEEFLHDLPEDLLVVFDEAYDVFIDVDDFPKSLELVRNQKNIIILKTFSKSFGLAGLRIGYALAHPQLVRYMEIVRQPFNVNFLAQVAAEAALEDKEFLKKTRQVILEGKNYLYVALNKMGLAYVPSAANFILIDVARDGARVFRQMLKYGVIVRDMQQYGLKDFIRVSIGTKEENERFIRALKKVLQY